MPHQRLDTKELDTIYLDPNDRFVVSLIIGCGERDDIDTPEAAASSALQLTRDEGSHGTHWFVYDRETGQMHTLVQNGFELAPML